MSGQVQTTRGWLRPSWNYHRPSENWPGMEAASLEMLESIRNLLENISRSQMLQCDVRHAILAIRDGQKRSQLQDDARWLERQARRTENAEEKDGLLRLAAKLRRRRV